MDSGKKRDEDQAIRDIEVSISKMNDLDDPLFFSILYRNKIVGLSGIKSWVLLQKEKDIRMKSRAIWVQPGDKNSKFLQSI